MTFPEMHADNTIANAELFLENNDHAWSSFFTSVKAFYQERGYITRGQAEALIKMRDKLEANKREAHNEHGFQQRRGQENLGSDMMPLLAMIEKAGAHLKYPRIVFRVGDTDFHMYPAGRTSKFPGWIQVKAKAENRWIGRINPETGELHGRYGPGVLAALKQFAQDPVEAARNYASLTGNCCFCARELTDPRSMTQGYGPVCADHYGLPWGAINHTSSVDEDDTYHDYEGDA